MSIAVLRPVRREFLIAFLLGILGLGLGRFILGPGGSWNLLGLLGTTAVFGTVAAHFPTFRSLDVSLSQWARSLMAPAAIWAAVMSAVSFLSMYISMLKSELYYLYDPFVVTDILGRGTAEGVGGEYVDWVEDGTTAVTWAQTAGLLFLCQLTAVVIGIALGLCYARWRLIGLLVALGAPLVGYLAVMFVIFGINPMVSFPTTACVVCAVHGVLALFIAWRIGSRIEP
ncbi:hypothetical protein KRX51_07635 [Corynebacterium sp. TAE3-ERU12]|uniref:hypothetical protein n=1 Tax=Corynebacterium sp. TAE3-ERU12 TaxID=2849491 RepID=UPI001C4824D4|nr:hypothetical protein [Corynebacterium sp. TAE3-ERU12]MBV7295785.1 hypothetical protein [Corynebacterium sp. TAE3-ERU12]